MVSLSSIAPGRSLEPSRTGIQLVRHRTMESIDHMVLLLGLFWPWALGKHWWCQENVQFGDENKQYANELECDRIRWFVRREIVLLRHWLIISRKEEQTARSRLQLPLFYSSGRVGDLPLPWLSTLSYIGALTPDPKGHNNQSAEPMGVGSRLGGKGRV